MLALMAPLPCAIDYRPYFHIHDPSFAKLAAPTSLAEPRRMLLGVTNAYFVRALEGWSNVVAVGTMPAVGSGVPTASASGVGRSGSGGRASLDGASLGRLGRLRQLVSPMRILQNVRDRRKGAAVLISGHREGLWTERGGGALLAADTALLNRVDDLEQKGDFKGGDDLLRQHFRVLTEALLEPFEAYVTPALPPEGVTAAVLWSSPDPPPLPELDRAELVRAVRLGSIGSGSVLAHRCRSAARRAELFLRFMGSPTFEAWWASRRAAAERLARHAWDHALLELDVQDALPQLRDAARVQAYKAAEALLRRRERDPRARAVLQSLFDALPRDAQSAVAFDAERLALMQGGRRVSGQHLPGRPSLSRP